MESVELMPEAQVNASFWQNKKVLVTGHTGFKGSWLGLWLIQLGAKVTGVGLLPERKQNLFEELKLKEKLSGHYVADIRDLQALKDIVRKTQPEVVLHLAAQPLVRQSYADPLGTWSTNLQGTLNLLEALKPLQHPCNLVIVTTDKVYANQEWDYGYRENDRLGGRDPYSASKAAVELATSSWRSSFCGQEKHQTPYLSIATARAGNVIGGGDWSDDRIVPDAIRALTRNHTIDVRNPNATRPWQHVLEPLSGYLMLAEHLAKETGDKSQYSKAFNFGPNIESNRSVKDLIEEIFKYWSGNWRDLSNPHSPHEANRLHLDISKAHHQLGWQPRWDFSTTVEKTVRWYKSTQDGANAHSNCLADIESYQAQPDFTNICEK